MESRLLVSVALYVLLTNGVCGLMSFTLSPRLHVHPSYRKSLGGSYLDMGKGFGGGAGGGGFGDSSSTAKKGNKKPKMSEVKKKHQEVLKKYGGDIGKGTARRVEQAMKELPPHLQMAAQLYQQLQKWNSHLATLSVLQQAGLPQQEMDGARRAQEELDRLYKEHDFTEHDLHNVFQRVTWDASADAKAARAITGEMPAHIVARVDRACEIAANCVKEYANGDGRCLDVGCGYGVLVPHLTSFGVKPKQIVGVDLSKEMIRNAREQHRGVEFHAVDYLKDYQNDEGFDSIILCSALHDFSDPQIVLQKSVSLLRPNGKLIIAHPQGASHVQRQANANPVLVRRGLPTAEELRGMSLDGMELEIEPASPRSKEEESEGYLAVLVKKA